MSAAETVAIGGEASVWLIMCRLRFYYLDAGSLHACLYAPRSQHAKIYNWTVFSKGLLVHVCIFSLFSWGYVNPIMKAVHLKACSCTRVLCRFPRI